MKQCIIGSPDVLHNVDFAANGGSMSSLTVVPEHINAKIFKVFCVSISRLLEKYGLDQKLSNVFVKIDTEGAESFIVPDFYNWLVQLKEKPTFFISLHPSFSKWDSKQRNNFVKVMHLFEHAGTFGKMKAGSSWNETELDACGWCDLILRDGPAKGHQ